MTTFAQQIEARQLGPTTVDSDPVTVGWTTIYEVVETGGWAHFVPTYVGVLGDVPAGLVYSPDSTLTGSRYEHV